MINRLSHSRLGNISFIALVTISYFVPRSLRSLVTKYDIVPRAIKLISPRLSYDNLYIYVYMCICVYVYMCICIYVYMYICMCLYMYNIYIYTYNTLSLFYFKFLYFT